MLDWLDARRTYNAVFPGLDQDHVTRAFIASALFCAALFLVTTPAWLTDTRTLDGVDLWTKPQKFNVSLIVHFATFAILAQLIPQVKRTSKVMTVAALAAVASMLFEQVYMTIQAGRARHSHFNSETNLEIVMYLIMGVGATILVLTGVVIAVMIWRTRGLRSSGLVFGSIAGLIVGALSTLAFAGYMSASGSHFVGVHPEGGQTLPFFGWSLETGDLRPAHFVALHCMQSLPLIGYVSDRAGSPAVRLVSIAAVLQVGLATALFANALAGRSLLAF
ncbi:MAG: hypothetical protein AAGA72_10185 [Pseudomonadota bacterium]